MVQVHIPVGRLRQEDGASTDPCGTLEARGWCKYRSLWDACGKRMVQVQIPVGRLREEDGASVHIHVGRLREEDGASTDPCGTLAGRGWCKYRSLWDA